MRFSIGAGSLFTLAACLFATAPASAATYGPCRFGSASLTFAGSVNDTAACLLRRVRERGSGADAQPVPQWLTAHMARPIEVSADQVRRYLSAHQIAAGDLTSTIVAGDTPRRRYFVIHDTSSPELRGATAFPADINETAYNEHALDGWVDTALQVNLITSRDGRSRLLRDWSRARPSPATKIEMTRRVPAAREVFVHVENIQPRINPDRSFFWQAPVPGLGPDQEQRLALAYVIASLRAGRWLIPAYHFNIDEGLADGHDDPQHMDLASWAGRIDAIVTEMTGGGGPRQAR
jgi:hypothetical protein